MITRMIRNFIFFCIVLSGLFVFSIYSKDGMDNQKNLMMEFIKNRAERILKSNSISKFNADNFSKELEDYAKSIGLNLNFKLDRAGDKFIFHGVGPNSRQEVFTAELTLKVNSYSCRVKIEPNPDGCTKSAIDGNLVVEQPLEAFFVKNGSILNFVTNIDIEKFNSFDKNYYKIVQYPSLHQLFILDDNIKEGSCGYFVLHNLLMACRGSLSPSQLLNRGDFESLLKILIASNNGKKESVSNRQLCDLIRKNIKECSNDNTFISIEGKINNKNILNDANIIGLVDKPIKERIRSFRVNGEPQYFILGTSNKSSGQSINGLKIGWDNINNRLDCVKGHWLAVKIEWVDKARPGECPALISVFDSSGPKDNRFAALIHWYYYIFVHSQI